MRSHLKYLGDNIQMQRVRRLPQSRASEVIFIIFDYEDSKLKKKPVNQKLGICT